MSLRRAAGSTLLAATVFVGLSGGTAFADSSHVDGRSWNNHHQSKSSDDWWGHDRRHGDDWWGHDRHHGDDCWWCDDEHHHRRHHHHHHDDDWGRW
jgi:hypothetical protein